MTTTPTPTRSNAVELYGQEVTLERPNGRKTSRALALLRALSKAMPSLQADLAEFRREYERNNVMELDRAQARLRYPALPLLDDETGEPVYDETGALRFLPSALDAMSEDDWARSGHVIRIPKSPSGEEIAVALFNQALEVAEDHVYRLLALFTLSNREVTLAHKGSPEALSDLIDERVDKILDEGYGDEWMPLGVAVGELVDRHFVQKARSLGDRMGNVLRLFGMNPASRTTTTAPSPSPSPSTSSNDGPTTSTLPSSSDTDDASDGDPTTSSTSDGPSSSKSPDSPTRPTPPNEPSAPSKSSAEAATV